MTNFVKLITMKSLVVLVVIKPFVAGLIEQLRVHLLTFVQKKLATPIRRNDGVLAEVANFHRRSLLRHDNILANSALLHVAHCVMEPMNVAESSLFRLERMNAANEANVTRRLKRCQFADAVSAEDAKHSRLLLHHGDHRTQQIGHEALAFHMISHASSVACEEGNNTLS